MVTPLLRKSQSPGLRLLVTVAHLTLNAYLGVAARGFLGKLFTLGCNNGGNLCFEGAPHCCPSAAAATAVVAAACKTGASAACQRAPKRTPFTLTPPAPAGGSYFKDLPSNMLGCFVIGLFAASTTVGLDTDKPLALLPAGHSWQRNLELHIGIRTGFCGCLTTFASWQLELVTLAVGESKVRWLVLRLGRRRVGWHMEAAGRHAKQAESSSSGGGSQPAAASTSTHARSAANRRSWRCPLLPCAPPARSGWPPFGAI